MVLVVFPVRGSYSTLSRNENRVNENHLEICLSFSPKNTNWLACVLVGGLASVSYLSSEAQRLGRASAESRAGEPGNCESLSHRYQKIVELAR